VDGADLFVLVPAADVHDRVLVQQHTARRQFTGFSLRWYEALTKDTKIVDGFWLSLQVATASGVASAVLGDFCCLCAGALPALPGRTLFSGMVNAPLVMPEVVIGLSLLLLMVGAQNAFGWPQRGMLTIVLGHTLLGMAYGMVVVQSPPDGNGPCH
jgi:putrescine transport system permease protein